MIAVSVVSHGHGAMVGHLADALLNCPEVSRLIVTKNVPEALDLPDDERVLVISNPRPKGFGANHNAAFSVSGQLFFCPLNPDIGFNINPFPRLLSDLRSTGAALVAPMAISADGGFADSARRFPTPLGLAKKALGLDDGSYAIRSDELVRPDWVSGMFMLLRSEAYARLGGFDEGFFLYYEDVDLCARLWKAGMSIIADPSVIVAHDARHDSHRDLRFMRRHLGGMARYFAKHWGRLPVTSAHSHGVG